MNEINEIIFITGHRKSGTSLLHRLFDNHNAINVYPDDLTIFYAYFPFYTQKYNGNKRKLIERITKIYANLFKFAKYNKNYESSKIRNSVDSLTKSLKKINLESKKEVFRTVINEWILLDNKNINKILLVKETSQSIFYKEFKKVFPKLKMINLIRDPRDNYASIKSGLKTYYEKIGEDEVSTLMSTVLRSRQDLFSAKINENDESFINIKYEDLVSKPKKTMKNLTSYLGIKYSDELIEPTIFGKPYFGNNFTKKIDGISKTNASNWEKRITNEECSIIEYFLYEVMDLWGYELKFKLEDSQNHFANFYEKYNGKYFFKDSFK